MKLSSGIHIGTSGWNYESWKGAFYPESLGPSKMLRAYAETFSTVEVYGTFYCLPKRETVREWRDQVPEDFRFAVKASRYLTHLKKLKDPEEPLERLFGVLEPFGNKLGPVLFQLPPKWKANPERLEALLEQLPPERPAAFEFRHPSWFCEEVYACLERHGVALCFYDFEQRQSPERQTADFVYVRLHGPEREAYRGSYGDEALGELARKCRAWEQEATSVFCYFDNDQEAFAPHDARRLRELLQEISTGDP